MWITRPLRKSVLKALILKSRDSTEIAKKMLSFPFGGREKLAAHAFSSGSPCEKFREQKGL
jgi:hypothetical protein